MFKNNTNVAMHSVGAMRETASVQFREALMALGSLGFQHHVSPDGVWIETAKSAFLFNKDSFSKSKVCRFDKWYRWYKSQADKTRALRILPSGVIAFKVRRRDWSKYPGAAIEPLAPAFPIKPSSSGITGSHSTVPGHLTELDCYDLQKRR